MRMEDDEALRIEAKKPALFRDDKKEKVDWREDEFSAWKKL